MPSSAPSTYPRRTPSQSPGRDVGEPPLHAAPELAGEQLAHPGQQRVLALEVVIERGAADAQVARQPARGERVHALGVDQPERRPDDRLARLIGAIRSGHGQYYAARLGVGAVSRRRPSARDRCCRRRPSRPSRGRSCRREPSSSPEDGLTGAAVGTAVGTAVGSAVGVAVGFGLRRFLGFGFGVRRRGGVRRGGGGRGERLVGRDRLGGQADRRLGEAAGGEAERRRQQQAQHADPDPEHPFTHRDHRRRRAAKSRQSAGR